MKRIVCTICLLILLVNGCTSCWYQPDKTLEQCLQDVIECKRQARNSGLFPLQLGFLSTSPSPMRQFYMDCMQMKGYRPYHKNYLPIGIKIQHVNRTACDFCAGK